MPFTFSEYLDYWLNDVCAQGSNGSRTLVQKQWIINLYHPAHLHKDILLGCVTPDYLNRVLESCQAYCCNGGYYAYKLLHNALKHARVNNWLPDMDFQQWHYPESPGNPVFYSPHSLHISDCRFQFQPLPGDSTGSFLRLYTREILGLKIWIPTAVMSRLSQSRGRTPSNDSGRTAS